MNILQDLVNLSQELVIADIEYKYQSQLTKKLDTHSGNSGYFSVQTLLAITLRKTNRYPTISQELLDDMNDLGKECNKYKTKKLLRKLLRLKDFDLPMASTVLRFAVPKKTSNN